MKAPRSPLAARVGSGWVGFIPVVALVGGALLLTGCGTLSASRNLDAMVAEAPAPVLVQRGQEFRTAVSVASHLTGAQAFVGAGESMEPIYASGTAVVVTPCDYTELRPGMSVVYVNAEGRGVAHALVERTRDGWVVQGANNPAPDADLVTPRNLVGVVTQAFASADTPERLKIAGRLMEERATSLRAMVALNNSRSSTGSKTLVSQ